VGLIMWKRNLLVVCMTLVVIDLLPFSVTFTRMLIHQL